jgi:hypothetical protein
MTPGEKVLRRGKEVWSCTMTAVSNPTAILRCRKSTLDSYNKDKKAIETHEALRCFRYDKTTYAKVLSDLRPLHL